MLLISILAFSYLNIMFVAGILGGLSNGIVSSLIDTGVSHIRIQPQEVPSKKDYIPDQGRLITQIKTIPGVVGAVRHYQLSGSFAYDKNKNGRYKYVSAQIVAVDLDKEATVFATANKVVEGSWLTGNPDQVVLGRSLAGGENADPSGNDLGGVKIGEKLLLTTASGTRTYTVVGIVDLGLGPTNSQALISADDAENILSIHDQASNISVRITDLSALRPTAVRIQSLVPHLVVKPYTDLLADIGTILNAFNLISIVVGVITVMVAAITIFVMIYVNAVNKRRQIGILRAIGIKPDIIVISYVLQSVFYTLCGIAAGAVLVFGIIQPYLIANPIKLPFGYTALVFTNTQLITGVLALFIAGIFGGFVPSRIVTKEEILSAIWG